MPVFSELIEKGDRKRAWRVASSLFWLMLLGLTALSALFVLVAPWIIGIFGNPGNDRSLTVGLSRVLFPIVALLGVSGIVVGILNSYDHFTVPALSPVFWNIAIIAGLAIGVPQAHSSSSKLYVYAVRDPGRDLHPGVPADAVAARPRPGRGATAGRPRLARPAGQAHLQADAARSRSGLGLINVNALIDIFFASRLINGNLAPTAIQKAFLVYMLPQGMFSVAIATVLFPSLSRLAARGDTAGFRETVGARAAPDRLPADPGGGGQRRARRADHPHPLPARPVDPRTRRRLSPPASPRSARGLVFNGAMLMLNRAFFSLQSNWIPTASRSETCS